MTESLTVHFTPESSPDTSRPDPHQDTFSKTYLGFWVYLMTDCILFATLFVTYALLQSHTFGGVTSQEIFSLSTAYIETMILLLSSVSCGMAVISAAKNRKNHVLLWLGVTFALGASFLTLELTEFNGLIQEGNSWRVSAFLSSFFALVGTHGLHITSGLIWAVVLFVQVYLKGLTVDTFRRLVIFSLFWHFLDLIWIFIFSLVYLIGVI